MWKEKANMPIKPLGTVAERTRIFLAEHGEIAEKILLAAIERAKELDHESKSRLGDFDYKGLKKKMLEKGIKYNPSQLLRKMEREYAIIETSYKSSTQHWWNFVERETIEKILVFEDEKTSNPYTILLLTQYKALQPKKLLSELYRINYKKILTTVDKNIIRNVVFGDLPKVVELIEKMSKEKTLYREELKLLEKIVNLTYSLVERMESEDL